MCRVIVSEQDNWKNGIKKYGRQFNDILDVYQDEAENHQTTTGSFQDVILGTFTQGDINKVQYSCDSSLFKSDMGKLVVDINKSSSNFNLLEKGKLLRYRQQLLNDDGSVLATADYKFFIITEIEEQKDKKSVLVTCYDHLIKAMQDYEVPKKRSTDRTFQDNKLYFQLANGKYVKYTGARTGDPFALNLYDNNLTYPITISNYLSKIMVWLYLGYTTLHVIQGNGINWGPKNTNLEIEKEHYLDSDSNSLGYTFRDVLDDIAECMGGRIQMQYDLVNGYWKKNFSISGVVRDYGIIFNEEMLNDKNVNMGELYTPNVIVLSRANDSDNIYYPATLPQNPVEVKISDNPILEQDNRGDFIQGIYENINGLSFHINDLATKGISANEIGDLYSVVIDNISYPCLMLSDDMIRSTGLKENIKTPEPKQSVTDYKYASYSDKVAITSKNAKILVDKANASIKQIVEAVGDNGEVTTASIVQSINDSGSQIKLNADKVYINGVTFDQNQKMTMTDGIIDITDTGAGGTPMLQITRQGNNNQYSIVGSYGVITNYEDSNGRNTSHFTESDIYTIYQNFTNDSVLEGEVTPYGVFVTYNDLNNSNYDSLGKLESNKFSLSHMDNTQWVEDITLTSGSQTGGQATINGALTTKYLYVTNSTSNQKSTIVCERTDTNKQIEFGVGAGGVNRGIFDEGQQKWLFYTDGTNTYINSSGNTKIDNTIVDSIRTKNMFDKYRALRGCEIQGSNGTITANSLWFVSDYIPVKANTSYTFSGKSGGTSYCCYNSSKTFIQTITGNVDNGTITIPNNSNIKYLRFNARLTSIDGLQMEEGSSATSYNEGQDLSPNDTGWVNCTTSQGTWSYCQIRRIGKVVHLRGYASSLGRPNGLIFTIPVGFRPSQSESAYGQAGWVSAPTISRWYINTDGTCGMDWNLSLVNGTDITENTWKRIDATWFID